MIYGEVNVGTYSDSLHQSRVATGHTKKENKDNDKGRDVKTKNPVGLSLFTNTKFQLGLDGK